jgi:rhodanese-related sulfurtransferase/DNA-directed RNA polymerase subunit RPC12/RpoP
MLLAYTASSQNTQKATVVDEYSCTPCGNDCDKIIFNKPGRCPHCNMALIKKTAIFFKTISHADICNYIETHPDVLLLDVRTKEEFENRGFRKYGTLKNAINIPIQEFPGRIKEMSIYKNKEIIVYCSHSQRSPQVCQMLTENGFTKVYNMAGGLSVMEDSSCKK